MTDDQLLADFLTDRDGPAFEGLVRRYGPMVLRVCRDILGDPADAEDASQATFLVLLRQARSVREPASLGRWLYEVACRIARRERRRVARLRFQERQAPTMDPEAPPEFDPVDREVKPILHDEVRRLPSKLRDAIVLCYFHGLTVEEAARQLRCPIGTLKSRLGKGREVLRSRLTRRGVAASVMLLLMFSMTDEVSAGVSDSWVDSAMKAGAGVALTRDSGMSSRIGRMVREEEASRRWSKLAVSATLILGVLAGLATTRLFSPAEAQAGPPGFLESPFAALGSGFGLLPAPIGSSCPSHARH